MRSDDATAVTPELTVRQAIKHSFKLHDGKKRDKTIRNHIRKFLKSNTFHLIVISLTLISLICLSGGLIIEIEKKHFVVLDRIFRYTGLTILSIFVVELFFKIIFIPQEFFHSKLEIFDGIVILSSFVIDVSFLVNAIPGAVGYIVALRFWRLARLIKGLTVINLFFWLTAISFLIIGIAGVVENHVKSKTKNYCQEINFLIDENSKMKMQISVQDNQLNDIRKVYWF